MDANANSVIRHLAHDMPTAMMGEGCYNWELKSSETRQLEPETEELGNTGGAH